MIGPGCTNNYIYVHVAAKHNVTVTNLVKSKKNPSKRSCGWVFWVRTQFSAAMDPDYFAIV